ncbi:fumarylacetoacetate hydrolase family protein [Enterovibrio sp. ZSDZ42]|uniref:Fumarylacetoacetate hydrolase family protein n=1 Tax=Enterovibrio gelatinilyticus TaxID=2899819 RepID=A0ABT5R677_9GAMM|nr:fumarylacetoacetate hydrolase family protein [Enterovibrio sp. ZSDZ42]MDD1795767.1 fumarylacetoacetate hydrolase family protein [Enterovibrio sp. ZSDZ42]
MYSHQWLSGGDIALPTGKVVCIGRNYVEHAQELNNPVPDEPVLFIKPSTALVGTSSNVVLRAELAPIHYEAELSVLIDKPLTHASALDVQDAIAGIGVALDLTRREAQSALKEKGLPWEISKAFDGSCVQSPFVSVKKTDDLSAIQYGLDLNGAPRQRGNTALMITPIISLICHLTQYFTLLPGDIVLTGTPKGVGQLHHGDSLSLSLSGDTVASFNCVVSSAVGGVVSDVVSP